MASPLLFWEGAVLGEGANWEANLVGIMCVWDNRAVTTSVNFLSSALYVYNKMAQTIDSKISVYRC